MSFDSSFNQRGLIFTEAMLATARHGYDRAMPYLFARERARSCKGTYAFEKNPVGIAYLRCIATTSLIVEPMRSLLVLLV
jgi:hypothetical protein